MLETARLLLRPWRESDREPFARMNADRRVRRYFPSTLTRRESDASVDLFETHLAEHGFTFFAAELRQTSEFIGFIGLARPTWRAHFTPCVEIGWRLDPAHWNQGLATEGARECLKFGFDNIGLEEIVALTVPANLPSRRVMEKLGMTYDPSDDFDHPRIAEEHPLRRHVLYRLRAAGFHPAIGLGL
jgi:ribosomal-protein-alanine N-acetyltransferase